MFCKEPLCQSFYKTSLAIF